MLLAGLSLWLHEIKKFAKAKLNNKIYTNFV